MAAASGPGRRPRVVVGVDGSPGARIALVDALGAAARRGADLDVVSAFSPRLVWTGGAPVDVPDAEAIRSDTERRARDLVVEVRQEQAGEPGIDDVGIRLVVTEGNPVPALLDAAAGADVLVVGSRGRGAMRSALLGSVALHCITHAPCPVVVTHAAPVDVPQEARIVVGVDGSTGSRAAVAAAVEDAVRTGAEVEAVAAYVVADSWTDLTTVAVPTREQIRDDQLHRTEDLVEQVLAEHTDAPSAPTIRTRVVEGPAGDVLVDRARGARLLVVGSHGRGAIRGLLLGSVALHCAMHAEAPVLVVRPQGTGAATATARPEPALADG